jgi:hypothetical protein
MLLSGRANPSFGSVRGDDPELASYLRIEERELEAGGVPPENSPA